jgi:Zn-finger protein
MNKKIVGEAEGNVWSNMSCHKIHMFEEATSMNPLWPKPGR